MCISRATPGATCWAADDEQAVSAGPIDCIKAKCMDKKVVVWAWEEYVAKDGCVGPSQ